ncbi:MAG: AmmeMemoRadiSam system protein A [Candidatus Binatia bacterium]|nr:MAG: AmmeMemoRadiSam system protein A [Candidatus Binatia bacterium]
MSVNESKALELPDESWELLGGLARESIRARLAGIAPPWLEGVPRPLRQPAGVFVTLFLGTQLRGCVGTVEASEPLFRTVPRLAVAAAFEDFRFPPVEWSEADKLTIEISLLSPLREVASPEEIVVGTHGVVLVHDGQRAVFLPKVAVEQGWDRTTLLEQLCRKAGLPADAVQRPGTKLFVFTTNSRRFPPEK